MRRAGARCGAQDAARDGIEHAHAASAQVEQHIVGDDRRRAAGGRCSTASPATDCRWRRRSSRSADAPLPLTTNTQVLPSAGLIQVAGCGKTPSPCGTANGAPTEPPRCPGPPGAAQIGEVEQPQHPVLAALQSQMLHVGSRRHRKDRRTGAADVGIGVVERRPVRRRVAVERLAAFTPCRRYRRAAAQCTDSLQLRMPSNCPTPAVKRCRSRSKCDRCPRRRRRPAAPRSHFARCASRRRFRRRDEMSQGAPPCRCTRC